MKKILATLVLILFAVPATANTPLSPALQSIDNANKVVRIAQLEALANQLAIEVQATNSVSPMGNGWALLGTGQFGSDGGALVSEWTPDGSPVSTHPISPILYPSLTVALTPTQLNQLLAIVLTVPTFAAGSQVNANGLTPALLQAVAPFPHLLPAPGQ